jgi:hypothetical protein
VIAVTGLLGGTCPQSRLTTHAVELPLDLEEGPLKSYAVELPVLAVEVLMECLDDDLVY